MYVAITIVWSASKLRTRAISFPEWSLLGAFRANSGDFFKKELRDIA